MLYNQFNRDAGLQAQVLQALRRVIRPAPCFYKIKHLPTLLQPGHGTGDALNITDDPVGIDDHRRGALQKEALFEAILLVDTPRWVSQDGEG